MSTRTSRDLSPLFLGFTCLFLTCLLLSNIIAGKIVTFWGLTLPAAVILFPITYIVGDVLTEVYGYHRARLVIWIGFLACLLMTVVFLIVLRLPSPGFWQDQPAYETVLGFTPRLALASLIAYLFGEFANAVVLSKLKLLCAGRRLWLRTIGSTLVGQALDTGVFITVAFWGVVPGPVLTGMLAGQYLWKVSYEGLATPLTYLAVGWVKRREGVDAYDYGVNYNPLKGIHVNEAESVSV